MTAPSFDDYFLRFLERYVEGGIPAPQGRIIRDLCERARSHHTCLPLERYGADERRALQALPICGAPGDDAPLILSGDRLFLHSHYLMEKEVAAMITRRNQPQLSQREGVIRDFLNQSFGDLPPSSGEAPVDFQRLAVFQAATRNLAIITGGPGTGKTFVVAKIMALLRALAPGIDIRLAAPTGKAAMRLMESLSPGGDELEAVTLHRLLGMRRDGRTFRYGEDNPVPVDALIIDEASMVDLAMMHRVLSALPEHARLILLGDPHQLPSVETGNVLGDLCAGEPSFSPAFRKAAAACVGPLQPGGKPGRLTDAITRLEKNYRFAADSAIGKLAAAIKSGVANLREAAVDDAIEVRDVAALSPEHCAAQLLPNWGDYLRLLGEPGAGAAELLKAFEQCRILCSHRRGFPGVEAINRAIELRLEQQGRKSPGARYFHGQPILITRNDYNLRLFNGDLGICVRQGDAWQVAFPFPGGLQYFPTPRLPAHETCYAMTVHKAQGSEFDHALLILPAMSAHQELLTRELAYTAVTRCKERVTIYCKESDWQTIMRETAQRVSGMSEFL